METIYVGIQTFLYSLILYSMIGFEWQADKFFWFYYYVFMCFVYFTLYGMMLVALTPNYQIAAIVMSFFLSFWNLFSGFLIPRMVISQNHSSFHKLNIMFIITSLYYEHVWLKLINATRLVNTKTVHKPKTVIS